MLSESSLALLWCFIGSAPTNPLSLLSESGLALLWRLIGSAPTIPLSLLSESSLPLLWCFRLLERLVILAHIHSLILAIKLINHAVPPFVVGW
jgi:hypothetical protein